MAQNDIYLPGMMNTGVVIPSKNISKGSPSTIRPAGTPTARGGLARSVAQKAVKNKVTAPKASKTTPTIPPLTAPPNLTPEDQALAANYGPNQLNLTDSQHIAGLSGKIQLPNAMNYANSMANLQYGNQIQQIAGRIKGLTAALPGSLQALDTAFKNLDAMKVSQVNNPQTSGQGVANLFSGTGATGAGGAAALAANQSAQASATSANQTGQLNDQNAAAGRREADWATRIQLLNNMAVNQGRTDLAGAVGQRDNAKKGYYDQALQTRGNMVSQAIANQGALNNQRISSALAGGQLESLGLGNEGRAIANQAAGTNLAALPALLQNQIQQGKQSILTSQFTNNLTFQAAQKQLKSTGVTSLRGAQKAGGFDALSGMILPKGAYGTDATTGRPKVFGDLNTYYKQGVEAIMNNLPDSNRKRVQLYVSNELNKVASATNQWVHKNGRYQKVAQGTTTTPKAGG